MPTWLLVMVLAVVFTAVLSIIQGVYWTIVARQERQQQELLRRLSGSTTVEYEESLFREAQADQTAKALGNMGQRMQDIIVAADAQITVTQLVTRMVGTGIVVAIASFFVLGIFGLLIGIPAVSIPYLILSNQATNRARKLVEQLPDSLELMSRSLQAGLGLNDAFRLVMEEMPMPISGEFGRVFEEVRFGRDYREAFTRMLDRNPAVFDLRLMVSSILLQRETGGNLIEILENIAETIRSRFVFHAKVKAMTAEAKFSALILGGLPMAVIGILSASNPEYLNPLFNDSKGHIVLAMCVLLYSTGVFIMRDLSNVEV